MNDVARNMGVQIFLRDLAEYVFKLTILSFPLTCADPNWQKILFFNTYTEAFLHFLKGVLMVEPNF